MNRPTIYTDITAANAEILHMTKRIELMEERLTVQADRIENFKAIINVLKQQIAIHKRMKEAI